MVLYVCIHEDIRKHFHQRWLHYWSTQVLHIGLISRYHTISSNSWTSSNLLHLWKQRRIYSFSATKTTKQLVTSANHPKLGLLWSYWRLIPFQLIGSSQAGTLSLSWYAQMGSVLTTQLYAHFWTWDEQKTFKYGAANTNARTRRRAPIQRM